MAADQPVAVVVVPAAEARAAGARGAAGLLVPGAGPTVTRDEARAALVRGRVRNAVLGGTVGGKPLITLARRPGATTIYVSLPPEGETHNVRRYPVAIVGPGYRGLLHSSATRLPGLVGIADLAPTAVALGRGDDPIVSAEPDGDAAGELRDLDRRLAAAHDARTAANVVVVAFVLVAALFGLARRSGLAARAAVLAGPAAVTAALLLSALGPTRAGALVVGFALAMPALALAGATARLVPVVAAFVALYALALAVWPETVSLGVVGPHPDGGVRFYGVTNQVETLLLAPVILAVDRSRAWVAVAIGALALFTIGASWTGADGGGVVVLAAAFAAIALLRSDVALSWRRAGVALAGAFAPRAPRRRGRRGRRRDEPRDARGRGWAGNAARRRARSAPPLGRLGVRFVGVRTPRRRRRRRARRARACRPPPANARRDVRRARRVAPRERLPRRRRAVRGARRAVDRRLRADA